MAIASRSGGNAQTTSTVFWMAKSVRPPKYPEMAPNPTPTMPETRTTVDAITSDIRAP